MQDFSNRSILIYDRGLFISLAESLVGKFGKVGYFSPWETSFSDGRELVLGQGLDGIEKVKYFEKDYRHYDLIAFPDVFDGWMIKDLRDSGFRVWGSGLGSELELLRWKTKERFKELGIPVKESHRVQGVNELRGFLKEHETENGWYIKVSVLRGLGETWCAKNYAQAKGYIDEFESKNGALSHVINFIIEASIPNADEVGYDGICIDDQFADAMWGAEDKDSAYFIKRAAYKELPDSVRSVNDALAPFLKQVQYRNFFHTELRDEFPTDITCRHASPAGEPMIENMDNLAEVMWHGAAGEFVQPKFKFQYGAQLILSSEWARDHWQLVQFPEEIRPWVKLYNHCRIDDGADIGMADYVVPQFVPHFDRMAEIGSVIALSDDPEEAKELCKERAEMVSGFKVQYEPDALDRAYEEMQSFTPALAS